MALLAGIPAEQGCWRHGFTFCFFPKMPTRRVLLFLDVLTFEVDHPAFILPYPLTTPDLHYFSPLGFTDPFQLQRACRTLTRRQWRRLRKNHRSSRPHRQRRQYSRLSFETLHVFAAFLIFSSFLNRTTPPGCSALISDSSILGISSVGWLLVLQVSRNHHMHALVGNPHILQLESLLFPNQDSHTTIENHSADATVYSRDLLLQCRRVSSELTFTPPLLRPSAEPRYRTRTGRRSSSWVSHQKSFYRCSKHPQSRGKNPGFNSKNSFKNLCFNSAAADEPAPPPRGAPGSNEECAPSPLTSALMDRGSPARRLRRQLYRAWRKWVKGSIPWRRAGTGSLSEGTPIRAVHKPPKETNAHMFRSTILQQTNHFNHQGPHPPLPSTFKLPYSYALKAATLNVQGMRDCLKHHLVLDLMRQRCLDVLFLTETRSTVYHSFSSQGYLSIANGSSGDPHAGVTAVISPRMRPHLANVNQISERVLQVELSSRSGNIHLIGAYAPHNGLDFHTVREPFWESLSQILTLVPQPLPIYILGDMNVRLQGRLSREADLLGPYVYGRGLCAVNSSWDSNRSLYLRFLEASDTRDVMSHRTPCPLHQISYRDKTPPPLEWSQFVADPLALQHLYTLLHFRFGDDALVISGRVRSFLSLPDVLPPLPSPVTTDFRRFNCLDRMLTRRQWLNSVHSCRTYPQSGFPNDHFLLESHIQVKLATRETPKEAT